MSNDIPGIVAEHIRAVNAFDTEAIVATFAKDAYVNDNHREIVGIDAIRRWVQKEIVGDHVTIEIRGHRFMSRALSLYLPATGGNLCARMMTKA